MELIDADVTAHWAWLHSVLQGTFYWQWLNGSRLAFCSAFLFGFECQNAKCLTLLGRLSYDNKKSLVKGKQVMLVGGLLVMCWFTWNFLFRHVLGK